MVFLLGLQTDLWAQTFSDQVANDPGGAIDSAVDAITAGNWKLAAAFALCLLMTGLIKLRDRYRWKIFSGKRGGTILVMVVSLAGAFGSVLATGAPIGKSVVSGVIVAWLAAGARTWLKNLLPNSWFKSAAPEATADAGDDTAPSSTGSSLPNLPSR